MKAKDIVALLKEGKQPLVKLTGSLWDDSWGEAGMLARIVSFKENHLDSVEPMVELDFNFDENKAHNLALQSHGYYLRGDEFPKKTGTAFESGLMNEDYIHEEVHFMLDGDGSDVPVKLADSPILAEYAKSGSKLSYVEWLEAKLEELVPDCMKDWKEGL